MGLRNGVFGVAAGALAVVLTMSACAASKGNGAGNGDDETKKLANTFSVDWNPQPRDKIKDGGTVTIPVTEIPSQENTMAVGTTTASAAIWNWYNPQLTFLTPEGKWSYNKDYLSDVSRSEKGGNTVVTYTLNPKAVWNDGTPMTWKSFELTWKSCNGSDSKYQTTSDCSNVTSVKQGLNDRQAVVTYDGPYAWWQSGFGAILNPHVTNSDIFNNAYQNKLQDDWGAGPYTVASANFKAGRIVFKRNPRWWGNKGKLDQVVYQQMEETAEINAFKNGEVDLATTATKDRLTQVQGMSDVTVHRSTSNGISLLILNASRPQLKDVNVRKAILEGIDRTTLAKIQYNGLGYTGAVGGSLILLPFQNGYSDSAGNAGYKYSADEANKLLDAAGWKTGADGVREKDGQKLTIQFPLSGDDPSTVAQGKAIISMEKEIGVQVNIKQIASADFIKTLTGHDWDAFMSGFSMSDPYGANYICYFYCSPAAGQAAAGNNSAAGTKGLDTQMRALAKIPDPDKQTQAAMKLESDWYKQTWGELPTVNGPAVVTTKKGLANLAPVPFFGLAAYGSVPVEDFGWEK
ncbi:ABC transporter family substrate-binding protein [Kribbella sp. NPDC050281]|uniref:ABC transporter family substrate-binding protein n=1 Tax=Kribbella sp. NPDC050281 TaxID=3155515 RepID=UPI0033E8B9D4